MQCIICYGEDISSTEIQEELKIANDIIYVPMTVLACHTCGERYYDRRTMRFVEEVTQQLRTGTAHLPAIGRVLVYTGEILEEAGDL